MRPTKENFVLTMASVFVTNANAMRDGQVKIALAKAKKTAVGKIQTKKFVREMETAFATNAFVMVLKNFRDSSAKNTR